RSETPTVISLDGVRLPSAQPAEVPAATGTPTNQATSTQATAQSPQPTTAAPGPAGQESAPPPEAGNVAVPFVIPVIPAPVSVAPSAPATTSPTPVPNAPP